MTLIFFDQINFSDNTPSVPREGELGMLQLVTPSPPTFIDTEATTSDIADIIDLAAASTQAARYGYSSTCVWDIEELFPNYSPGRADAYIQIAEALYNGWVSGGGSGIFGFYGEPPRRSYFKALDNPPNGTTYIEWQAENDTYAGMVPFITATFPSIYTFYSISPDSPGTETIESWKTYATENIREANRVSGNLPCYPYLRWRYVNDGGDPPGGAGTPIAGSVWAAQLAHLKTEYDAGNIAGVVLWDYGYSFATQTAEEWWLETLNFQGTVNPNQRIDLRLSSPRSAAILGGAPKFLVDNGKHRYFDSTGVLRPAKQQMFANANLTGNPKGSTPSGNALDFANVASTLNLDGQTQYGIEVDGGASPGGRTFFTNYIGRVDNGQAELKPSTVYEFGFRLQSRTTAFNSIRVMGNSGTGHTGHSESAILGTDINAAAPGDWLSGTYTTPAGPLNSAEYVTFRFGLGVDNNSPGKAVFTHPYFWEYNGSNPADTWIAEGHFQAQDSTPDPFFRPRIGSHVYV